MDKFIIADIDSYMGAAGPPCLGLEKNQVALDQFSFSHPLARLELLTGCTRELNIKNLIDFLDKGRTIDPLESRSSEAIGHSKEGLHDPYEKVAFS